VDDGPVLLRLAPQRKGDRPPTEHLIPPFASEDVLELDVTQTYLRFGNEIVDRLITIAATVDDDLPGCLVGVLRLRLGDGEWNLALLLLRTRVRGGFLGGSWRLGCRGML
jgi:hypothetical protein